MNDTPILEPSIEAYLTANVCDRPAVVREMERQAAESRFPIVGPVVGQFLALMTRAIGARRVFELGSGFGYSTFWFASAVGDAGEVFHTDGSSRNSQQAQQNLHQASLDSRVRFAVGDGRELLAEQQGPFDVIFCDIDKNQYPDVPALAYPRLREQGLLIFDNALWFGRVTREPDADDADTQGVLDVTQQLQADRRWLTSLVPLRDGLLLAVKIGER